MAALYPPNASPPLPSPTSPENRSRGILLNPSSSSSPHPRPNLISTISSPGFFNRDSETSPIESIITPILRDLPDGSTSRMSVEFPISAVERPKIRFAPLPDARRPRSLSTGRNMNWKAELSQNGQRTRQLEIRGYDRSDGYDETALDDMEMVDEDHESGRGRKWSKTIGTYSGWTGTKKLLKAASGEREESLGYSSGAPLKKSISTGGFIGRQVNSRFTRS